jgi:hypothetical protein
VHSGPQVLQIEYGQLGPQDSQVSQVPQFVKQVSQEGSLVGQVTAEQTSSVSHSGPQVLQIVQVPPLILLASSFSMVTKLLTLSSLSFSFFFLGIVFIPPYF